MLNCRAGEGVDPCRYIKIKGTKNEKIDRYRYDCGHP